MMRDVPTKPYLLVRYVTYSECVVEYFDSPDEALQHADLSRGDVVAKVLQIRVVDPDVEAKEAR